MQNTERFVSFEIFIFLLFVKIKSKECVYEFYMCQPQLSFGFYRIVLWNAAWAESFVLNIWIVLNGFWCFEYLDCFNGFLVLVVLLFCGQRLGRARLQDWLCTWTTYHAVH